MRKKMDFKKIIPVNGLIVVVDDPVEEKKGSIFIPETADKEGAIIGTVLETSCFMLQDGTYMDPEMEIGDKVIYPQHAGAACTFKKDGKLYRTLRHNEIMAIVEL
jgi:co-chaperonin GroES (HSP10)